MNTSFALLYKELTGYMHFIGSKLRLAVETRAILDVLHRGVDRLMAGCRW